MTPPSTFEPVSEAQETLTKLFRGRNWLLFLPSLFAHISYLAIMFALWWFVWRDYAPTPFIFDPRTMSAPPLHHVEQYPIWFAALFLASFVSTFTTGWTLGAAPFVWEGKEPDLKSAFRLAARKFVSLVGFYIIALLIVALTAITIFGPLVILIFLLYGGPYIMFENKSPVGALGSSFQLVKNNFGDTLIALVAMLIVGVGTYVIWRLLGLIPDLPLPIAIVIQILYPVIDDAYSVLIVYRFYNRLTQKANPA